MARQKALTIILETLKVSDFTPGDKILCVWRIRGSIMAASLPSRSLWSIPDGKRVGSGVLALGVYVYWDGGSEEHVLCLAVRGQEDESVKGYKIEREAPGILHNESETGDRLRSDTTDTEGSERASGNGQVSI
jgi:hypothetical protein